jgi:hypothetical protein
VIEDFDGELVERTFFMPDIAASELLCRLHTAQAQLLERRGGDYAFGRRLPMLLQAGGLENVAADGYLAAGPGGSVPTRGTSV